MVLQAAAQSRVRAVQRAIRAFAGERGVPLDAIGDTSYRLAADVDAGSSRPEKRARTNISLTNPSLASLISNSAQAYTYFDAIVTHVFLDGDHGIVLGGEVWAFLSDQFLQHSHGLRALPLHSGGGDAALLREPRRGAVPSQGAR
eukprot:tig00020875_g14894.t1